MRTDFYERREARIERLRERATQKGRDADAYLARAKRMASVIPFGQPILVGHHSEGRDRRYRAKIESGFRRGFESMEEAKDLKMRAAAAADNDAISSDAPDAVDLMRAKIAEMEKEQETWKKINAALRRKDDTALVALGLKEATIAKLKEPDCCGRTGIPDYKLKNNNANIRRCKQRLAYLEAIAQRAAAAEESGAEPVTTEYTGDVKVVENAVENRLQILFPGKPDLKVRDALKSHGFRWAPTCGAWQRQLHNNARWSAESALASVGITKVKESA